MKNLAQVVKIQSIEPIQDADKIEKAKVLAWQAVVRKGLHKEGDLVAFIFPDTLIPKRLLDESADSNEKIRLKTVKMKGQYSAGLIVPLSAISNFDPESAFEGQDLTSILEIEKYEKPVPAQISGETIGNFPTSLVCKTDEDNYRSNPEAIEELNEERFDGQEIVGTIKIDGSSATFLTDPQSGEFKVCSRNFILKENAKNSFWKAATKYEIEKAIRSSGKNLAIQGELCGNGIQGNPLALSDIEIRVFLIKNLDSRTWLSWDEVKSFCQENGIPTVPEIFRIKKDELRENLADLQQKVNSLRYSESNKVAEGVVLRTVTPIYSNVLQKWWWSLKIISEPYDLKN